MALAARDLIDGSCGWRSCRYMALADGDPAARWRWGLEILPLDGSGGWRCHRYMILAAGDHAAIWLWGLEILLLDGSGGWRSGC